jgi:4-alpha-glucanotransferase
VTTTGGRGSVLGRFSLRNRMALLVGAAVTATVAVVAGVALATTGIVLNNSIDDQLLDQAVAAASTVRVDRVANDLQTFSLESFSFGLPAQLVDADGGVYSARFSPVGPLPTDDGDIAVARGATGSRLRSIELGGVNYRMATVAVGQELRFVHGRELALQLARPMSDVEATLRELGLVLLAVGLGGIVGSALLGRLVARAALKPVDAVAAAAEGVAHTQNLSALIPVTGSDEIARLAASLNSMLRTLEASRARQRQLVDDASHELRTPLTSLRTNIELLIRAEANPHRLLPAADRTALLRDVDAQIRELSGLVTELVELARDEVVAEDTERLDLAEVVRAAVERARRRANAKGVCIEVGAEPSAVDGRPQALERAVTNLLDNAVKFTPESSTVRVWTAHGEVVVTDEGPGIAPEDAAQVFLRFYRAAGARGLPGSGLGLAIVAEAVADHGGTVEASSAPGGGALLRMRLPLAAADDADEAVQADLPPLPAFAAAWEGGGRAARPGGRIAGVSSDAIQPPPPAATTVPAASPAASTGSADPPADSAYPAGPGDAAAGPADSAYPAGLADLAELAAACGVATAYRGAGDRTVSVSPAALRAVLGLLGVDAADPAAALERRRDAPWRRLVPPASVVRRSAPAPVLVHVTPGVAVAAELVLETGAQVEIADIGPVARRRVVDGRELVAVPVGLPSGLPLGDHSLRVRAGGETGTGAVVVVPDRLPEPAGRADGVPGRADGTAEPAGRAGGAPAAQATSATPGRRMWGWMIQLYALRSAGSWGIGDYADLARLAEWSGSAAGGRADVLLVNPLHACAPTFPIEASPYFPASRRYVSPLYLRPEDTPEYAEAPAPVRAAIDALAASARAANPDVPDHPGGPGRPDAPGEAGLAGEAGGPGLLDRDAVWRAKLSALELLYDRARRAGREPGAEDPADTPGGRDLTDFATWCALAERHGPDWRRWPEGLRDPRGEAVAAARAGLADRVDFHRWLQRRSDGQLAAAQAAARAAGMSVGIVHDLAVGVDPGGADAWGLADVFAADAAVGAPPDEFNQLGQNWGVPPWRPDRLADTGYAAFRQMVAAVLRRGGGLRVDHVLGLFRLWWVPSGHGPADGAYVRYDEEAMLGVLALEATRAGAVVVGEDLGTVEPSVAASLARVGVLGSAVLWFERDGDGAPKKPSAWRERVVASVSTHDLPTAAGYVRGEHVRLRARLGILVRPEADEHAAWRAEFAALLGLLRREGLLTGMAAEGDDAVAAGAEETVGAEEAAGAADGASVEEIVLALHRLLVATPARVVLASPADAVGDVRQPNVPGTVDEYPNWRLPVADATGRPVTLERFTADPAVRRLVDVLTAVRAGRRRGADPDSPDSPDPSGSAESPGSPESADVRRSVRSDRAGESGL